MTKNIELNTFESKYSEHSFIKKIGRFLGILSSEFLFKIITLWFTLRDKDTPTWAKSVILGALGYFIVPLDAIPDIMPLVGFSDDLTALVSASAMIFSYIKPEHKQKAKEKMRILFESKKKENSENK